ncbi:MAG: glutamate formimidoyltransferase [Anaerolineae bacterium]|nr:glutamate formimidoyltransferase [Anaerolineae bacterium]
MKILLCIPNISEGRNREVVEQVVAEVRRIEGVKILNYSSDADHNRSVLTYLGEPEPVLAATKAMAARALTLIDMSRQQGAHPRLGAVDVVPFVPLREVETEEAVNLARQFGRFLGELGVPVYYYEDAATQPERVNLADIRRGQYEGLPEKFKDPAWLPDEGPATFNAKSGATVTGARFPLIAFNVNLRTTDVSIARRIARAVRHSSGGYRYVKAMGLAVKEQGLVQVSMNLTNYTQTPIPRVLETIRLEAARHGVSVAGSELIGTMPLGALEEVVKHYLQAHDFKLNQIVEYSLLE